MPNTNLENLAIENVLLYPPFDNSVTHYNIEVGYKISNLNILAVPEDENASVEVIGKDGLKDGKNIVFVVVTASDGFTKKEYIIDVYKRTLREEEKYENDQKENQKKLENVYQVQRTSTLVNKIEDNVKENVMKTEDVKVKSSFIFAIGIVIIIFTTLYVKANQ